MFFSACCRCPALCSGSKPFSTCCPCLEPALLRRGWGAAGSIAPRLGLRTSGAHGVAAGRINHQELLLERDRVQSGAKGLGIRELSSSRLCPDLGPVTEGHWPKLCNGDESMALPHGRVNAGALGTFTPHRNRLESRDPGKQVYGTLLSLSAGKDLRHQGFITGGAGSSLYSYSCPTLLIIGPCFQLHVSLPNCRFPGWGFLASCLTPAESSGNRSTLSRNESGKTACFAQLPNRP